MHLQTKALYNLLKFNFYDDPQMTCEKWQVEDLRKVEIEDLFSKLKDLGIVLDKNYFLAFSHNCDSPEEMSDLIIDEEMEDKYDQIYLVIFELWRKLIPERPSFSIFFDELDHRIFLFDKGLLKTDEQIQDSLAILAKLLHDNIEREKDEIEFFASLSTYTAHDLQSFLYDYISNQIEENNTYASELLEQFYPMMENSKKWFDFLRLRINMRIDQDLAHQILKDLIQSLNESSDTLLMLEILKFLVPIGDPSQFLKLAKIIHRHVKFEKEFDLLLQISSDFFRRLDQEDRGNQLQDILEKRIGKDPSKKINSRDTDFKKLDLIFNKS